MHLQDLVSGQHVRLVDFGSTPLSYRRRLLSRGLTCGIEIFVLHVAPLGCPVLIQVRETLLVLRKDEASALMWERV